MSVVVEKASQLLHVEDLYKPGIPGKFVELIEGELVVMNPAGWKHSQVGYNFVKVFDDFCLSHDNLQFAPDNTGFLLQRDPDVVLCPDAALYRRRDLEDTPWIPFAPEIAVEVLSPSNSPTEMAYKRRRYFEAGSEQVWIADLQTKTIEFWFKDGRRIIVQGDEIAKGEGIAESMEINLPTIFTVRN